jgi:hypothetical protein
MQPPLTSPLPSPLASWQIQLTGALDTTLDVEVFTLDIDTPESVLRSLHSAERLVFCYFSAGTREPFRDDADAFPDAAVGLPLSDYPDERWVDVRDQTVRSIMEARVAKAADQGCDGIHPSGLGAFLSSTGLDFGRADQLDYNRWLSGVAHEHGISIGLAETEAELSAALVDDFDWAVVWSCLDSDCQAAAPFTELGKAAFLVEYGDESSAADVCPRAKALGLSAIIKRDADLDAFRVGCP